MMTMGNLSPYPLYFGAPQNRGRKPAELSTSEKQLILGYLNTLSKTRANGDRLVISQAVDDLLRRYPKQQYFPGFFKLAHGVFVKNFRDIATQFPGVKSTETNGRPIYYWSEETQQD